jgi:hypothetical protein
VNSKQATHDAPPYVYFYAEERLAMCGTASGGRRAVVRRKEIAERVPLASTCVAGGSLVGFLVSADEEFWI